MSTCPNGWRPFHTLGGETLAGVLAMISSFHPRPNDPAAKLFPHEEYRHDFKKVLRALDKAHPGQHGSFRWSEGEVAFVCGTSIEQLQNQYTM